MDLTHKDRLIRLIEVFAGADASPRRRAEAGDRIAKNFPPMRRTELYANVLRDVRLSDRARWIVMLMLYYVGNDHAIRGFTSFYGDPEMPDELKLDALLFAYSLNPRLEFDPGPAAPRFPASWLANGLRKLPPLPTAVRRDYVLGCLHTDLFGERSEP